jgi:hypothetical protein
VHTDLVDHDERWTAGQSPHEVPYGLRVAAGATLTVDPCAVVRVAPGKGLTVRARSALVAVGAAEEPVRFVPLGDPSGAGWLGIDFEPEARENSRLGYVTLERAGAAPELVDEVASALRVRMRRPLRVDHLTVADAEGYAVALTDGARFAEGTFALAFTGTRGEGVAYVSDVDAVASVAEPALRANRRDDLVVAARRRELTASARWASRGLRYRVLAATHLTVEGPASPTLTLGPGVTLAFDPGAELVVGWDAPGALALEGAPDALVRLVPAEGSAPASWGGVYLGARTDLARTRLENVEIVGGATDPAMGWRVCASPGEAPSPRALLALDALPRLPTFTRIRLLAGPPDGYAVLLAGDHQGPVGPLDGVDASLAGTRCVAPEAVVRGVCAPVAPCAQRSPRSVHIPGAGARH